MQKIIRIDGMSCGHCSARVEKDLKAGTAVVESEALPDDAALRAAIEDLGFDCLSIENA